MKIFTFKRPGLLMVLALLSTLLLGACGDNATSTPAPAPTTAAATTAAPAGSSSQTNPNANPNAVTLTFWGDWSGEGEKQFNTMVDAFNKTHKDIQVKYVVTEDMITKFLTAATSGDSPDIMFWDRWRTALYAPKGVLRPIDDLMKQDNINASDYYQEAIKEMTWNNQIYGLPLTVDARGLFYNKKLLSDAGINPPTTWDELEQAAKKLTVWNGSKLERAGFSMQDVGLFNMYLQQAGGQMVTDDGSKTAFNSPQGQTVLNYWDKLLNQDKVYQVGFEDGLGKDQDAFVTGKVAMLYTGPWMISTYKKYGKDLDFGIVPPPAGPNGNRGDVMGGFSLVIPKAAKHQKEAWEFEKWWLAQPENALMWAKTSLNIPGNLKAIQDPYFQNDPFWKPILDSLQFARIRPPFAGYSPMEVDGLIPNLQLFMQGKLTAQQTLQKSQEAGDKLLQENNLK
ncbi:MAG TPA: ABC transporter substrate-binding protein [Chloroflexia bacterium]|nr:ABC transporter substrate-binding protein [Chloroflexia bacterium]